MPATNNRRNTPAAAAVVLSTALFMASTLGTQSGAEAMPFGKYTLTTQADGRPELTGGSYAADGSIERNLYDAPGQPYDKKPRSIYFTAVHNQTGIEYRLSGKALQDAIKATAGTSEEVSIEDFADGIDLQQVVAEVGGYKRASVHFEPQA